MMYNNFNSRNINSLTDTVTYLTIKHVKGTMRSAKYKN